MLEVLVNAREHVNVKYFFTIFSVESLTFTHKSYEPTAPGVKEAVAFVPNFCIVDHADED